MRTIRIDEDVWKALQRKAIPFEDNPNSVLRQILGVAKPEEAEVPENSRSASRRPILQALTEMGGPCLTDDVMKRVEEIMKPHFEQSDYERHRSGEPRWRNSARWERQRMVEEGLLKKDSRRGYWEISEKGRQYYEQRT